MFGVLLRARGRMLVNTVRAAPRWQQAVITLLSLSGVLFFLGIAAVCAALVILAQGGARTHGLSASAQAVTERIYEYLFFFLVAGSIPFVSATLFQADDLPLLLTTPTPPRAIVAAKLLDAALVNAAQFIVLGIPVLAGLGWAAQLSFAGWLWLGVATLLLLALPPAMTALLLLLAARLLGMRRVRLAVTALSVCLGLAVTLLAVVGASRATHQGFFDTVQLRAAMRGEVTQPLPSNPVVIPDTAPHWLPSAWAAAMLQETAGGRPINGRGLAGFLALFGMTGVFVAGCLAVGPGVLSSEAFLEADSGADSVGATRPSLRLRGLPPPISGMVVKDLKYLRRDLILIGQIGTALILVFVPFLLKLSQGHLAGGDSDLYGDLALGMLVLIVYMVTSILSLTSVGLEGRGGWLVLSAPLSRGALLRAKWLWAFGLSVGIVAVLTVIDTLAFGVSAPIALTAFVFYVCACFALSGMGVGLSGLFPRFIYENPAHRASVWALILGFVFGTLYLIVCGLIGVLAYFAVTQLSVALAPSITVAIISFLLVSLATGFVPVSLAARRLKNYEWEF